MVSGIGLFPYALGSWRWARRLTGARDRNAAAESCHTHSKPECVVPDVARLYAPLHVQSPY
jgi:hypothetical protein